MSDPKAIAKSFLDAYTGFAASGNAAGLASLYGPDSVADYDGTLQRGAEAISAAFIAPRAAGGFQLRFASTEAHFTPTNQLFIVVTGESTKPPGRFSQVFVLNSLPSGGMYVKVDICRFGPGAAPQQVGADSTGMGAGFAQQYYTLYTSNRVGLAGVYNATKSQLTFEGQGPLVGQAAIAAKLPTLPAGRHEMATLDAVTASDAPVNGVGPAVVVLVTGKITLDGEANPLGFCQAFLLAVEGGAPFCANEIMNFNYG